MTFPYCNEKQKIKSKTSKKQRQKENDRRNHKITKKKYHRIKLRKE